MLTCAPQFDDVIACSFNNRPTAKRETRFTSRLSPEETIESLTWALVKVGIKDADILVKLDRLTIIVTTTDGRDDELDFACRCYPRADEEKITVDFRLTRGDGIEFKRKFMEMCDILFDRYKDDRKMKACTELQPAALGRQ